MCASDVHSEAVVAIRCIGAQFAPEWLLAGVNHAVRAQPGRKLKSRATDITAIPARFLRISHASGRDQLAAREEGRPTQSYWHLKYTQEEID